MTPLEDFLARLIALEHWYLWKTRP